MARNRIIKKYGNSFVVSLTKTDMKDLGFKEGSKVDIEKLKDKDNEENEN